MRVCADLSHSGRLVAGRAPDYHRARQPTKGGRVHVRTITVGSGRSGSWPARRRWRRRSGPAEPIQRRSPPATSGGRSCASSRRIEVQAQRAGVDLERPRSGGPAGPVGPAGPRRARRTGQASQGPSRACRAAPTATRAAGRDRASRTRGTSGAGRPGGPSGPPGRTALRARRAAACTRHDGSAGTVAVVDRRRRRHRAPLHGRRRAPASSAALRPGVVINEIDYDQVGADTGGFVEIANTSGSAVASTASRSSS